jgi:hypothetical protein
MHLAVVSRASCSWEARKAREEEHLEVKRFRPNPQENIFFSSRASAAMCPISLSEYPTLS